MFSFNGTVGHGTGEEGLGAAGGGKGIHRKQVVRFGAVHGAAAVLLYMVSYGWEAHPVFPNKPPHAVTYDTPTPVSYAVVCVSYIPGTWFTITSACLSSGSSQDMASVVL